VTITISPAIYPHVETGASNATESSAWHELIRLRDSTREVITRYSGEPLL
jgi:hypothetical protein